MVFVCCVPGCRNKLFKKNVNPELSFHRFPRDPALKEAWVRACGNGYWIPKSERTVICCGHFRKEDFNRTYASGVVKLREGVVPSVFPKVELGTRSSLGVGHTSKKKTPSKQEAKVKMMHKKAGRRDIKNEFELGNADSVASSSNEIDNLGRNGGESRIRKKTWKLREEEEMSMMQLVEKSKPKLRKKYVKRSTSLVSDSQVDIASSEHSKVSTKTTPNETHGVVQPITACNVVLSPLPRSSTSPSNKKTMPNETHGVVQPITACNVILSPLPCSSTSAETKLSNENQSLSSTPVASSVTPTVFPPIFQPIANVYFLVVPQKANEGDNSTNSSQPAAANTTAGVSNAANADHGGTSDLITTTSHPKINTAVTIDANHVMMNNQKAEVNPIHKRETNNKKGLERTLKLKQLTVELAEARMRRKLIIQSLRRLRKKIEKTNSEQDDEQPDQKRHSNNLLADTLKEKVLNFELSQEVKRIVGLQQSRRKFKKQGLRTMGRGLNGKTSDISDANLEVELDVMESGDRVHRRVGGTVVGSGLARRILPKMDLSTDASKVDPFNLYDADVDCSLGNGTILNISTSEQRTELQGNDDILLENDEAVTTENLGPSGDGISNQELSSDETTIPKKCKNGNNINNTLKIIEDCLIGANESQEKIICPELGCSVNAGGYKALRRHLNSVHGLSLESHSLHTFETHTAFLRWKTNIERQTLSRYVILGDFTAKRDPAGGGHRQYGCVKAAPGTCPSTLEVTTDLVEDTTSPAVTAWLFPTHYGHTSGRTQSDDDCSIGSVSNRDWEDICRQDNLEDPQYLYENYDNLEEVEYFDTELEIYSDDIIPEEVGLGNNSENNLVTNPQQVLEKKNKGELEGEEEKEEVENMVEPQWSQSSKLHRVGNTIVYPIPGTSSGTTVGGIKPAVVTDPVKERVLLTLRTAEDMVLQMTTLTAKRAQTIVDDLLDIIDKLTEPYEAMAATSTVLRVGDTIKRKDHAYC